MAGDENELYLLTIFGSDELSQLIETAVTEQSFLGSELGGESVKDSFVHMPPTTPGHENLAFNIFFVLGNKFKSIFWYES